MVEVSAKIIIPGEGPDNARIMLIGQNPGHQEAKLLRPFVGRSGKYLDSVLKKFGIDRSRLYITAAVKFPTPRNRKPTPAEITAGIPELVAEIKRIKPEIIVLMGEVAKLTPRLPGIRYIETCHPAAAMRFPKLRERFEADMQRLAGLAEDLK